MPIGSDFTIDYVNKRVYHSANTNVYSVNDLYSWLLGQFDELTAMDDQVPISAQTPTEYTMINGWFLDDESVKYLASGAIKTTGYTNDIRVLNVHSSTNWTNFESGDVGLPISGATTGDEGTVLAYDNPRKKIWIRMLTADDLFDNTNEALAGALVTGTAQTAEASPTGEDLFANVYTLGTIETTPYPQVYVFQSGSSLNEWSTLANWDPGQIDVLVKVKEADTEINEGNITVFARQYSDLYDHFPIDLTAGGRNAVPLATALDLNNASGSHYLLYDGHSVDFEVGQTINGDTGDASAEVLAVTEYVDDTDGLLELGNVKGTFQDGENLSITSTVCAVANGVPGDTWISYDSEVTGFTSGSTVSGTDTGPARTIAGVRDGGTSGVLVGVTGENYIADIADASATNYMTFPSGENISGSAGGSGVTDVQSITLTSGHDDIRIIFVNGTMTYGSEDNALIVGEEVYGQTSDATGTVLLNVDSGTSGTLTLGNIIGVFENAEKLVGSTAGDAASSTSIITKVSTMTKAFEQGTNEPYNAIIDCNGNYLTTVYSYFKYVTGEDSTFSTYPTYYSGAAINWETLDGEEYLYAYRDVDTPANTYPPVKASPFGTFAGGTYFGAKGIWIEDMHSSDVKNYQLIDAEGDTNNPPNKQSIGVTNLLSGDRVAVFLRSGSVVDKSQFDSHATFNDPATASYTTAAAIPVDTPAAGYIRLVNQGTGVEERIQYTSWAGSVFQLGAAHAGSYASDDTAYVGWIDVSTTNTEESTEVIYATSRNLLIRVRRATATAIIPFEAEGTFGSTGFTIGAIRTDDLIIS